MPAFTWVATANVVLYCGATPVLADVSRDTYNIDPADVAAQTERRARSAVIVVHLFGLCADIEALRAVLPPRVALIEDAACAAGASQRGVPVGGLGVAAAFSFHPRKSITTGEGGMVTTNDPQLARTADMLRNHGAEISEEQRHRGPRPYLLRGIQPAGLQLPHDGLAGSGGTRAARQARPLRRRARALGALVHAGAAVAAVAAHAGAAGRRCPRLAGVRDLRRSAARAAAAQHDHGGAAARRRQHAARHACGAHARLLPQAFWLRAGRLPGGARLRRQHHGHPAAQPHERRGLPLRRRAPARDRRLARSHVRHRRTSQSRRRAAPRRSCCGA